MSHLGLMTDAPASPRRRSRRRRRRRRRGRSAFAVLLSFVLVSGLLAAAGYAGFLAYERFLGAGPDYDGPGSGEVVVQVEAGDTAHDIGVALEEADVVRSTRAFVTAAKDEPRSSGIQPGFYKLRLRMKASLALDLMLDPGSRMLGRVAVPEGYRASQVLELVSEEAELPIEELQAAAGDAEALGLPEGAGGNPEGYLFPATYDVEPDATPADLLRGMVERFDQAAEAVDLAAGAQRLGLTPHEVVTVASLVQAEGRPDDFGKVARVVYNRLERGERLRFDSTVLYAMGKTGQVKLHQEDLDYDSPYNTYQHAGLPPGPISNPGEGALRAALNPEPGDWLYFVTVNPDTGETKFTDSYEEHLRFKEEFDAYVKSKQNGE